eukprot:s804_g17.t1
MLKHCRGQVLDDGSLTSPCEAFAALHGGNSDDEDEEPDHADHTDHVASTSTRSSTWSLPRCLRRYRRLLLGIAGPALQGVQQMPIIHVQTPPQNPVPDFIQNSLNCPDLADVVFILGHETPVEQIYAHRLVLAASCEHFRATFSNYAEACLPVSALSVEPFEISTRVVTPRVAMAALFGAWTTMSQLRSLDDILDHFDVSERVWRAFELQVGSPGADYRLLAALPKVALVTGCGNATTDQGPFTPIEATQVGLVWRLARRAVAAQSGVSEEDFIDVDPWQEAASTTGGGTARPEPGSRTGSGVKERVLKMSALIDQQDDSELLPPMASEVDKWYQNFILIMGSQPDESEEPTAAQLAALHKKVYVENRAPYCDFSVWVPFERRMSRLQKCRTFTPLGDGSYLQKDLPGPGSHSAWRASWNVFKVPRDWDPQKPWSSIFIFLAADLEFWAERVHHPAAAWTAAGGRGAPTVASEAAILEVIQGGPKALKADSDVSPGTTESRKTQANMLVRREQQQIGRSWRDTGRRRQLAPRAPLEARPKERERHGTSQGQRYASAGHRAVVTAQKFPQEVSARGPLNGSTNADYACRHLTVTQTAKHDL